VTDPRRARGSLRLRLVAWLVLPVMFILAVSAWLSYGSAMRLATLVTDRQLLASARVIAEQVEYGDSGIQVVIPPAAVELFASDSHDEVAYAVIDPRGMLVAGFPGLEPPAKLPSDFGHRVFDTSFRTKPMRAVALRQPVLAPDGTVPVSVIVGETLRARNDLVRSLWLRGFIEEAALVLAGAISIWIGINSEMVPLLRLRQAVLDRPVDRFEPFDANDVQTEIRPLVEALNSHMERVGTMVSRQRRFLDMAAHQLRTPLTIMKTQVGYARRAGDAAEKDAALTAVDSDLTAMSRLTNQILILGRIEHERAVLPTEIVDLGDLTRQIVSEAAPRALDRGVELVFDTDSGCVVQATQALVREIVVNLLDNVVSHSGVGTTATVMVRRAAAMAVLTVEDDGAGVDEAERSGLLGRFRRGSHARAGGSGLGLSIVAEVVELFGGSVELGAPGGRRGFRVIVRMPLAQGRQAAGRHVS
jgi:two-component system sensor histidine kinase TctE